MRIIGNGLLSGVFYEDYRDCLIFASGVSNSNENLDHNFKREEQLLIDSIKKYNELTFVYFSTVFINRDTPYYNHKKNMEKIIKENCENYLIIRLPQIVGKIGNQNNIFNLFKNRIYNNQILEVYKDASRSLVDVDDVKKVVIYCIDNKIFGEVNFVEIENINVLDLSKKISKILNKELNYIILDKKEDSVNFKNSFIIEEMFEKKIINKQNYIDKILKKYL